MKIRNDPTAKPYYRCLLCTRFRKNCGGRPTRDYDLQNWCEYMRDVKEHFHLTNQHIADAAEVSLKTIERIMAINCEQDIMRATARRIEQAIIGPVGDHTCYLDYEATSNTALIDELNAKVEHLLQENKRYAKIVDRYLND